MPYKRKLSEQAPQATRDRYFFFREIARMDKAFRETVRSPSRKVPWDSVALMMGTEAEEHYEAMEEGG